MKPSLLALTVTLLVGVFTSARAQQWTALGSGLSGPGFEESVVERIVEIDGKLYAFGYFNNAGDVTTWSVAYWDGQAWHGHGIGIDSMAGVLDLVKFEGELVAFLTWGATELIYRWNGLDWVPFPSTGLGTANIYVDAEVHNGQLYLLQDAGGVFKFNGSSWDLLPGSDQLEGLRTLASYKNELYIGTQYGLYKYNGSQIQQVWAPANIYGLKVFDNILYMTGGYLGVVGTADTMTGVAMFDGVQPISLGKAFAVDTTEFTEVINDVTKIGDRLFAGGDVHTAIFGHSNILTYSGGSWEVIGVADNLVRSLVTIGSTVYVGGYFFTISNQPFSNVAAVSFSEVDHAIRGHVFFDIDNNCERGPLDKPLREHVVRAMPGPFFTSTAADGSYTLFVDPGTYTITASPLTYASGCSPEAYTITDTASGVDFGFKSIDDTARVEAYILAGRYVAGRVNTIVLMVMNQSGVPATDVSVRLELSPYLTFLSSDHSYQQIGPQEYLFTIPLIPIRDYERIIVTDSVDVNGMGEYAHSRVFSLTGLGAAFVDHDMELILGPHDPNEKLVATQLEGAPLVRQDTIEADDVLTYKVNFQNVGTDTAYQVVIRDTISPMLDLSTFQTLSSSHPYKVELLGSNIVTWTFDDIKLPDSTTNNVASNGGVRYRIAQTAGNSPGTSVINKAAIYFDFNPPVITNEAISIIGTPSHVSREQFSNAIVITPNPASNETLLDIPGHVGEIATITFHNVLGKEVLSARYSLPAAIDLRTLARGVHFISVKLPSGESFYGKMLID